MSFNTPPSGLPDEPPSDIADAEKTENEIELRDVAGLSQGQIVLRRFLRHRGAMVGLVVLILIILLAITSIGIGPIPGWWKWDPTTQQVAQHGVNGAPTMGLPRWLGGDGFRIGEAPFGQDELGRDIFARTMQGTQTSLIVMFVVGAVSAVVGVLVGALAGFYRGATDSILMRVTDLIITFPIIVIGSVLGVLVGKTGPVLLAAVLG